MRARTSIIRHAGVLLAWFAITLLVPVQQLAAREPRLGDVERIPLSTLHPTQAAVGMREVQEKRDEITALRNSPKHLEKFLSKHPIPVIIGPEGQLYMTDHHHLGLALRLEGVPRAYVKITEDASTLTPDAFWKHLDAEKMLWLENQEGRRIVPSDLPSRIDDLGDDPYRSLSGAVRDAGGYQKTHEPFAEFAWADFFRSRIPASDLASNFEGAVQRALLLAHGSDASALPGFVGEH